VIYISIGIVYLIFINFLIKFFKFFEHNKEFLEHKNINNEKLVQSGGIFFFPFIIYEIFEGNFLYNLEIYSLSFVLLLFLIIGFLSDFKKELHPKLRLIFYFILVSFLIYINQFFIKKTNIPFLDFFLNYELFKYFFTIFCILVFINGLNFIDGINLNASGYIFQTLLILILLKINNEDNQNFDFIIILFQFIGIFMIFNIFFKNILGDSGIYILGIILSLIIINFVNENSYTSPLLAVLLLWYPAFENLFSIIRKSIKKTNPFGSDTYHLHTMLFKFLNTRLKIKNKNFKNNLAGLLINILLMPNLLIAHFFYDNSKVLILFTILYIILYIWVYIFMKKILNKDIE
jgi:UDP-N-acetylmuramyl pentapeptide phosphotransferase/UDP-N-acetylglucosamine-1-phosphate transferase